jgi:hypothetical protein
MFTFGVNTAGPSFSRRDNKFCKRLDLTSKYNFVPGRRLLGLQPYASGLSTGPEKGTRRHTDVVVIGAGIIGLSCARELLKADPDLNVTVLERGQGICSQLTGAATGAGQGYIWLAHRDPTNEAMWQLAQRGIELWQQEVDELSISR